jgi:hypothetical protein
VLGYSDEALQRLLVHPLDLMHENDRVLMARRVRVLWRLRRHCPSRTRPTSHACSYCSRDVSILRLHISGVIEIVVQSRIRAKTLPTDASPIVHDR